MQRQEVARLCRVAGDRPRWQWIFAGVVSIWSLSWIAGQFVATPDAPSALTVLGGLGGLVGLVDDAWVDQVTLVWRDAAGVQAVLGGLLWAATTERGQAPALLGWVVVMLAAEGVGYQRAVVTAIASLAGFVLLLWFLAMTGRGFVDRRASLLPNDVLRAGATAAALSAVVPLLALGAFAARVFRPYVTLAPRPLDTDALPGSPR